MTAMKSQLFEPRRLSINSECDREILGHRLLSYMTVNHHSLITRNKTHEIQIDDDRFDALQVRYDNGAYQVRLVMSNGSTCLHVAHETPYGAVITFRRELDRFEIDHASLGGGEA